MRHHVLFLVLFCGITNAIAQTSLLQDDDGKSSFNLTNNPKGLAVNVNVADKSLAVSMVDDNFKLSDRYYFGGQLKVSGKDGKFPLAKEGNPNFQIEGSFSYYYQLSKKSTSYYAYATVKGGVGRVNLIEQATATDAVLSQTETSISKSIQIGINSDILLKGSDILSNVTAGVAIAIGQGDNLRKIEPLEYRQVKFSGVDDKGNPVIAASESKEGYSRNEFKKDLNVINSMIDIGYVVRVARQIPMVHLRWDSYTADTYGTFYSPGMGLYFTEDGDPYSVVCGLQLFYKDWNNEKGADTSRFDRAVVNFVVGFKF